MKRLIFKAVLAMLSLAIAMCASYGTGTEIGDHSAENVIRTTTAHILRMEDSLKTIHVTDGGVVIKPEDLKALDVLRFSILVFQMRIENDLIVSGREKWLNDRNMEVVRQIQTVLKEAEPSLRMEKITQANSVLVLKAIAAALGNMKESLGMTAQKRE